jgi:hypothetical protein
MNNQVTPGAWENYKRVRNRALTWILVFFLISPAVAYVSVRLIASTTPGLVFALVAMLVAAFSVWQFINWPCPRCGETFGAPLGHCRHCQLPKWGG